MNLITPLILIIISIGTFFVYTDRNYRGNDLSNGERSIKSLQVEQAEYQKALNNTNEIRKKRESLVATRGEIDPINLEKLEKLLPDNIDNIKLVIDMNRIAQNHGLMLKNIKLDTATKSDSTKLGQDNNKYGTVGLSFSITSSYDNFQNFLTDLEKSLRLVEIVDLSVTGNDTGIYEFSVGLKTYWLK
jgi:Tfp pilus assembly protein PilO